MCLPWKHQWEERARFETDVYPESRGSRSTRSYVVYILKCTLCGWLKRLKFNT